MSIDIFEKLIKRDRAIFDFASSIKSVQDPLYEPEIKYSFYHNRTG
jgi:hypothetical protein